MKISNMEKLLKKVKKDMGDCKINEVIVNGNKISIVFENKNKEDFIYSHDFSKKKLFNLKNNNIKYSRSDVYWGNKTDAECEEYNKNGHW